MPNRHWPCKAAPADISGAKFVWAAETNNFDNAFNSIVSLMRVAIPSAWNSLPGVGAAPQEGSEAHKHSHMLIQVHRTPPPG